MKIIERIKMLCLTEYEKTLYEFLEQREVKLDYNYAHLINTSSFSKLGKMIIRGAFKRHNQRVKHAELIQRIALGGKTAEEVEQENEKVSVVRMRNGAYASVDASTGLDFPFADDIPPQQGLQLRGGLETSAEVNKRRKVQEGVLRGGDESSNAQGVV